jgi:hypothetical protein
MVLYPFDLHNTFSRVARILARIAVRIYAARDE